MDQCTLLKKLLKEGVSNFSDVDSCIERCCDMLLKWHWLYKERATHILVSGVISSEPFLDIVKHLKIIDKAVLTLIPQGYFKEEWPIELKYFIKECYEMKMKIPLFIVDEVKFCEKAFKGMSPKKKEEATKLAVLVAQVCREANVSTVVDVGSGLGYVDRLLSEHFSLDVIGLERDVAKVEKAIQYGGKVAYKVVDITSNSLDEVTRLLNDCLRDKSACLVCLHACGDLSIHTELIFRRLPQFQCLVNVPCCYHLGSLYPLNERLKHVVTPNLLRLASENSADKWCNSSDEIRRSQALSVLSRAVLEEFIVNESIEVKKTRRKLMKTVMRTWEECLDCVISGTSGLDKERLSKFWIGRDTLLDEVAIYLSLQTSLQGLTESLLLLDRIGQYRNDEFVSGLLKIFKSELSPRSIAIISFKL